MKLMDEKKSYKRYEGQDLPKFFVQKYFSIGYVIMFVIFSRFVLAYPVPGVSISGLAIFK